VHREYLAYMFKYDSMHGMYPGEVTISGSDLVVDGKTIKAYTEKCALWPPACVPLLHRRAILDAVGRQAGAPEPLELSVVPRLQGPRVDSLGHGRRHLRVRLHWRVHDQGEGAQPVSKLIG